MSKKDQNMASSQYNPTDLMVCKTIHWTPELLITNALAERQTFKWFRDDDKIVGENSNSYKLTIIDLGHDIPSSISLINDDISQTCNAGSVAVSFTSSDQSDAAVAAALTLNQHDGSISQKLVFDLNNETVKVGAIDEGLKYTDPTIAQFKWGNSNDNRTPDGSKYQATEEGINANSLTEYNFNPVDMGI